MITVDKTQAWKLFQRGIITCDELIEVVEEVLLDAGIPWEGICEMLRKEATS